FELLLCHRMSLQGQECGDLILISAKSSIYSTKPRKTAQQFNGLKHSSKNNYYFYSYFPLRRNVRL
ncbi:hypothetical protein F9C28_05275, partial [Shimwellia pseudoproteus]|nr:hypothetical protein [Shimwellia pseudoproteus]